MQNGFYCFGYFGFSRCGGLDDEELSEVQEEVKETKEQELVPLLERPDGQLVLF
ncbi:hypothetical protein PDQ34_26635 [Bacillus cereus]|nr:hypothetical protein [Bacillus cereus]MDA2572693.1 hypothetical protein [Bacillus cereus]